MGWPGSGNCSPYSQASDISITILSNKVNKLMEEYKQIPNDRSLVPLETPDKEVRSEKYELLKKLIINIGDWNVNVYALSKKWGLPNQTLYKWKDKIVAERGVIDITKVGNQIQQNMISNINLLQKSIHSARTIYEKKQAVNAYNETIKTFTDFLEAYGYKEKIADKLEINQKSVIVMFNDPNDKYPDIESEKRRRKENL